jgi:hypothetical protein
MPELDPYNPLELEALGQSLLRQLERQPAHPLSQLARFEGAGLYALYYSGRIQQYAAIGEFNRSYGSRIPIYVGRARDPGARKGLDPFRPVSEPLLWQRIKDHRRSIESVSNLDLADFSVRILIVLPIWIPLAEAMAIRQYRPLWNTHVQGFGIHAPGSGRHQQKLSHWDLLHPGRSFVAKLKRNESIARETLVEGIREAADAAVALARSAMILQDIHESKLPQPLPTAPGPRSRSGASPRPKRR